MGFNIGMIERTEFQLITPDTHETLFVQSWKPQQPAHHCILITHGIFEHSECYHLTAQTLAEKGVHVFAWDLPGHGKSYGQRGFVHNFAELTDRLSLVLDKVQAQVGSLPVILLGHSLGGLITLKYAIQNLNTNAKAVVLSSPALGVRVQVPAYKDQAARLLAKIAPRLTLSESLVYEDLSRDPEIVKTYYKDPLRHKKVSAPLYLGMLEAMADVKERAHQLTIPIYIQAAGADRIVSLPDTEAFFQKIASPQKKLQVYPQSYHEIYNDTNRKEVIDDLLNHLGQF